MRTHIRYSLFVLLTILFSCDKLPLNIQCSECTKDEPVTATLKINIDGSRSYVESNVIVNIYSGNLEDGILIATFTTTNSDATYQVTINKKYTLTATYHINSKTYVTVDSVTPGVKYDTSQCTDPCYYIYNNKVNLKLKYT